MKWRPSPSWAADYAERQAEARLRREQAINAVIERRRPDLRPTEEYRRTAVSSFSARFYTREQWLNYECRRTMAKYDPRVKVDRR